MKRQALIFLALLLTVFGLSAMYSAAQAQDATPTPEPLTAAALSVTIYNQGTALVQDRRNFTLNAGENVIDFTDVAALIEPTSVNFVSLTDPRGTVVLEQNYLFDLVNSSALVRRYIDQQIRVTLQDGTLFEGTLLNGDGDLILRQADGQVVVVGRGFVRDLQFPALPSGLITRPTLRWIVQSAQSGPQDVALTYLTGGLNWQADYVLLLDRDNTALDLNGWVTLTNTSGARFNEAQVKLIAGDVNRLPDPEMVMRAQGAVADQMMAAPAPGVEQREFNQYQLYEIARPVTLAQNETKQVEFVSGANIPATTFFVYDSSPQYFGYPQTDQYYGATGITDVQNWLEFSTAEQGGLGRDLPAGNVRVYQEDIDGAALLIGENRIDHTPTGETVRLFLGNAFDLVGERRQVSFQLVASNVLEETYEIRLRNRKDSETVEVRVPETLFRWTNWQILNSSQSYTQLDSNHIEFRASVPPQGEAIITYTVRYSLP